ncbi:MAG TPA: hypothetical protein VHQ65_17325 [Thermoanaerobaculia bacterium]|nr:hypothetical protein [Thermoanaerobaculia bacterium]
MFSLQRRSMVLVCAVLAVLALTALPAAAAPAPTPEERADLVVAVREWMGELLDSVLAALGLTTGTDDPAPADTTTPPVTPPETSYATEPTSDDEGGNWDPNGG